MKLVKSFRSSFIFAVLAPLILAACSSTEAPTADPASVKYIATQSEESGRIGYNKETGEAVLSSQAAAITPTNGVALAAALQGSGVTITSAALAGDGLQGGTFSFSGIDDVVGFSNGIILSSGRVTDVQGPNGSSATSFNFPGGGDADLNTLVGGSTQDAAVLNITFVPDGPRVFFRYVFSSEEYNEYVNSQFNDVFGFFVNGVNYATVGGQPVSVNNIHNGNTSPAFGATGTGVGSNPTFYRNNAGGALSPSLGLYTEMDGLTTVLTFQAPVNIGVPNTLKLAIADRADGILDSAVFIQGGTFSTTPPVNAGPDVGGDEGSAIALVGVAPDAAVAETTAWTVSSPLCTIADPSALSTTVTCTDNGVFTATLTVSSALFGTYSDDALVTVANVAPSITTFSVAPDLVAVNTLVNGNAAFTDPGTNDTHTALFDWGDTTTSAGSVGSGSVAGSHSYTTPGVYTVSLTVTDDDNDSDTATFQYVVVYDPNGGFVTGGGWINSPAGAYYTDPSLTGRANFGFVSKYKKGANVPDGSTQFQFQAGDLNFHSSSYQWLVVAGSKAQFKGEGAVNGAPGYGFLLTANDGSPDKFRIKIWELAGGSTVYDNQLGAADTTDATTALAGGSIVIHSK